MRIPAFFYGFTKDVKSRCRSMVYRLRNGATWNDAVEAHAMIETKHHEGLILLHGTNPLLAGSLHFHCYLPLSYVSNLTSAGQLAPEIEEKIFVGSLQVAWGLLGLFSQTNVMWVYPQQRHSPFLQASVLFWEMLAQEGNHYSNGSTQGENLWTLHTNLKYILANADVSQQKLNQPLPSEGLKGLLKQRQNEKGVRIILNDD